MIRAFVRRPAMTTVFILLFVVLGLVSYRELIIEEWPRVEFPLVTVEAVYAGASPEEVESQIIKKIEDAVGEVSQIKRMQSFAFESMGRVLIEFETEADADIKGIEVKDKIEPILDELPDGADKPQIYKFDPLVEPVVDLVLSSGKRSERDLFEYADKKLRDRFTVIEGVGSVDVFGGKQRRVNVWLHPPLMKKHFISIKDVIEAVSNRNLNVPGGTIDRSDLRSAVRMVGEFESVSEIADMALVSPEGRKLRLRDIATVEDGHKKVETLTRFNGKGVVGLSIKKLSDANAVEVVTRVRGHSEEMRKSLPEGMRLEVANDKTPRLLADTGGTIRNIVYGIILTIAILFVFLGDWRITVVAAVVIPASLVSALFPMRAAGFSINILTLLAMATALGTLIANALVVIDSVVLHLDKGKTPVDAAVDGTKEATLAVLAAAGTNLVVFTPLAFMRGMVGEFMAHFGMTVIFATVYSLIASFSLTPMMCALLLKHKGRGGEADARQGRMQAFSDGLVSLLVAEYKRLFDWTLRHPVLTLMICAALFYSVKVPLRHIGSDFAPASDRDKIRADVEMPQGSLLERTLGAAKEIEGLAAKIPEVESALTYVGVGGAENASVTINLKDKTRRRRSDLDIINELTPEAAKIPDAEISFMRLEFSMQEADVTLNLYGRDYDVMAPLAERMRALMMESGYFRSVQSSYKSPKEEIRFFPDHDKMIRFGVTNSDVGGAIRSAVTGDDDNVLREEGEEYDIGIEYDELYKGSLEDIGGVDIMSRDGLIPISMLGEVRRDKGSSFVRRRDKERVIQLGGYLSKGSSGEARALMDEAFKKLDLPDGYRYKYVGDAEYEEESDREIGKAFTLAVIFTYMLLAAILNSFLFPFVIVTTVATSFVGVFYLLFFAGFSMNVGAQLALVMLVGLVVNNAILMLDYAIKKMEEGKELMEALWLGASVKFRAILMTSLAVVFGAAPQIRDMDMVKASMGGVIVGGMLASIVFTLLLIPVLFQLACRAKDRVRGLLIRP